MSPLLLLSLVLPYVRASTLSLEEGNPALSFEQNWQKVNDILGNTSAGRVLKVALPESTSTFTYVAPRQQAGSVYGFCLDCDQEDFSIDIIDGTDPSLASEALSPPMNIFTREIDPSVAHQLTLLSMPDNRTDFSASVHFSSIQVTIEDRDASTTLPTPQPTPTVTPSSPTTTSSSETTLTASSLSTTDISSSILGPDTPSISSSTTPQNTSAPASNAVRLSKPMIIGIACIAAVALLAIIIAIFFCTYIRRRRLEQDTEMGYGGDAPNFASLQAPLVQPPQEARLSEARPLSYDFPMPPTYPSRPVNPYVYYRPADMPIDVSTLRGPGVMRPVTPTVRDAETRPDSSLLPMNRDSGISFSAPAMQHGQQNLAVPQPPMPTPLPMAARKKPSVDIPTHVVTGPQRFGSLANLGSPASATSPSPWLARKVNYDVTSRPSFPRP